MSFLRLMKKKEKPKMKNDHDKGKYQDTNYQKLFNIIVLIMIILILVSLFFITQSIKDNADAIRNIDEKTQSISQGINIQ